MYSVKILNNLSYAARLARSKYNVYCNTYIITWVSMFCPVLLVILHG